MEYVFIAMIVGLAVWFVIRQVRRSWRGDSPCSCCSHSCRKADEKSPCDSIRQNRD